MKLDVDCSLLFSGIADRFMLSIDDKGAPVAADATTGAIVAHLVVYRTIARLASERFGATLTPKQAAEVFGCWALHAPMAEDVHASAPAPAAAPAPSKAKPSKARAEAPALSLELFSPATNEEEPTENVVNQPPRKPPTRIPPPPPSTRPAFSRPTAPARPAPATFAKPTTTKPPIIPPAADADVDSLGREDLKALATSLGLDFPGHLKGDELRALVRQAQASGLKSAEAVEEAPPVKSSAPPVRDRWDVMPVPLVRKRIKELAMNPAEDFANDAGKMRSYLRAHDSEAA